MRLLGGRHGCAFAIQHVSAAGRKNPASLNSLAAAYAEMGRFDDAIKVVEQAISVGRLSADSDMVKLSKNLLDSFKAKRPYREAPRL